MKVFSGAILYEASNEPDMYLEASQMSMREHICKIVNKYKSLQAGQEPQEHLSFLQSLLNFIITKYLQQEVDTDLSVLVDECHPCGLSITRDIEIYQCYMIKR